MFAREDKGVVFFETSMSLRRKRHVFIECIPLPRDLADEAPIYFKKAIIESDEEWAQHAKLFDTTGKGLARSVPKGFPFFHVEFGLDRGFAHVVENEELFPHHFGRGTVGGMLDVSADVWLRPKPPADNARRIREFAMMWAPFDWTKALE